MRKVTNKKRTSRAASSSAGSSNDDDNSGNSETEQKTSSSTNRAGKKDGANVFEDKKKQKISEEKSLKSNSSSHKKNKSSNGQSDGKNKRKRPSKDERDQSNDSDSSDDETLSKIAKISKETTDTSSKGKENKKHKEKQKPLDEDVDDDDGSEDEEYEVEEVVSHKKSHGKMLYLIRWKGFGADDDTWENAATLDNCPDILKKYTDAHPDSVLSKSTTDSKDKKQKKIKKIKDTAVVEEFDENADYEVEKIIDVFFKKKDKSREFLVRWKGYRSEHDTWEPEEHLNCPDLIDKFMAKVEHAKNLSEKELRTHRKHTDRFTLSTQTSERRLSRRHDGKQRAVYYDAED